MHEARKSLSEMTLEELWQLFPISLTEHRDCWRDWYDEECREIRKFLPEAVGLSHVGSTAILGIWAKPIVDILVEVPPSVGLSTVKRTFAEHGYLCMSESDDRASFNKGYTPCGFAERVFHLHVRRKGDCDELFFRDYLNAHPDVAGEYERLKIGLWKRFEHDRDGYTAAKTDFVRKWTAVAKGPDLDRDDAPIPGSSQRTVLHQCGSH